MDYKQLGARVRQERVKRNLTQEKLAELGGISSSYIGIIERGDKILSVETLVKIATALDVSTDYLLKDSVTQLPESRANDMLRLMKDLNPKEMDMVFDVVSVITAHISKG